VELGHQIVDLSAETDTPDVWRLTFRIAGG
jgi:hypothetical protein